MFFVYLVPVFSLCSHRGKPGPRLADLSAMLDGSKLMAQVRSVIIFAPPFMGDKLPGGHSIDSNSVLLWRSCVDVGVSVRM